MTPPDARSIVFGVVAATFVPRGGDGSGWFFRNHLAPNGVDYCEGSRWEASSDDIRAAEVEAR